MGTSLELKSVGDLSGTFFVPAYQRGYRWGEDEVVKLLNDIWDNKAPVYCLQPVVVKARTEGPGDWELVDGQQRLTTLYLVFRYMKIAGLKNPDPPYSLEYQTRRASADYLRDPRDTEAAKSNIDFFHMQKAYSCIVKWFDQPSLTPTQKQFRADEFYGMLCRRVKIIWYEAPGEVESTAMFARLNVGRIPLTDAELLKALLLGANTADALRREEVAAQWDAIEHALHDEDFWAFVTNAKADQYPARIELLFALLAHVDPLARRVRYQTFDELQRQVEANRSAFWAEVLALFAQLREWYEDRGLYHKVGFLIAEGESLRALLDEARDKPRSALRSSLDTRIQKRLALTEDDLLDLRYDADRKRCERVLTLANVEAVRALSESTERYPFRAHKRARWSLEHIHAQHAEGLTKKAQWDAWLVAHRDALDALPMDDNERTKLKQRIDEARPTLTRETFETLAEDVSAHFHRSDGQQDDDLHGLGNLALLDGTHNSALNNAAFEVKRQRILALDKAGAYIPLCTRRVFLKYFTNADAQQVHFWSPQDRAAWLDAIVAILKPYLSPETSP